MEATTVNINSFGGSSFSGDTSTALIEAAHQGHASVVKLLLENGADPYIGADRWGSALEVAIEHGSEACVRVLLDNDADFANHCKKIELWPLALAVDKGVIKLLLDNGVDPNGHTEGSASALMSAAEAVQYDIIELLLDYGADVNYRCDDWWMALNAIQSTLIRTYKLAGEFHDLIQCIKLLLLHGAKIDQPDEQWEEWLSSRNYFVIGCTQALQEICGKPSREGGFTRSNIDGYMKQLEDALQDIWHKEIDKQSDYTERAVSAK